MPLVEALDSVAGATGSIVYDNAVKQMRDDISVGHQLQLAMKQTGLFPNMVVQMIAVGEESGALDNMLFKVAEFYEEEVSNAVDTLSSLLEPLIMVVLGVLVGGMVVAHVPADLQARRHVLERLTSRSIALPQLWPAPRRMCGAFLVRRNADARQLPYSSWIALAGRARACWSAAFSTW